MHYVDNLCCHTVILRFTVYPETFSLPCIRIFYRELRVHDIIDNIAHIYKYIISYQAKDEVTLWNVRIIAVW